MPATQTPCTPEADRFLRSVSVPDPPSSPFARQRYWEDTVQEAVGELRRRLASSRDEVVTLALLTIVKIEMARMRHGRPVSGTQVSNVREADDRRDPLPKLSPLEMDLPPAPKPPGKVHTTHGLAAGGESAVDPIPQVSEPTAPVVAAPQPSTPILPVVAGSEAGTMPSAPEPVPVRPASERGPPDAPAPPALSPSADPADGSGPPPLQRSHGFRRSFPTRDGGIDPCAARSSSA